MCKTVSLHLQLKGDYIMNEVIARIDVTTPSGRRIVRNLEKNKKAVKVEYPLPPEIAEQKWYTVEEVFNELEKKINDHYGTNYKLRY